MRCEFTLQQLSKLATLSEQGWRTLISFLRKDNGAGEFTPDMQELKDKGMIKVITPMAYAKFPVDGVEPLKTSPQSRGKKAGGGGELRTLLGLFKSKFPLSENDPKDILCAKKLVQNFSIDELVVMMNNYHRFNQHAVPCISRMWVSRQRLIHVDDLSRFDQR